MKRVVRSSALPFLAALAALASLPAEACLPRGFHVVERELPESEARAYCREKHTDLATVLSAAEGARLPACGGSGRGCLIGLHRDHARPDRWLWPWGGAAAYAPWRSDGGEDEVRNHSVEVVNGGWRAVYHADRRYFICEDVKLVVVRENKTWEEALDHCRALQADLSLDYNTQNALYDLPSLQSERDLYYARRMLQKASTDQVWTGLRYLGNQWLWVNGDKLWHRDLPPCPAQGRYCGTLSKHGGAWDIHDCEERKNFFCYKRSLK